LKFGGGGEPIRCGLARLQFIKSKEKPGLGYRVRELT